MNSPLLLTAGEAVVWSSLDSVWQMGLLWILYRAIIRSLSIESPALRHRIALLHYSSGFALFICTFYLHLNGGMLPSVRNLPRAVTDDMLTAMRFKDVLSQWLALTYFALVLFHLLRIANGFWAIRNLTAHENRQIPFFLTALMNKWLDRFNLFSNVQLRLSENNSGPFTTGCWKPLVYLPISVLTNLSSQQVESLLIHELIHVRRNDYIINIFLRLTHAFFYFNPFAKEFLVSLDMYRELAVDENVLSVYDRPLEYAAALLSIQNNAVSPLAMNANSGGRPLLLLRMERITGNKLSYPYKRKFKSGLWFFILVLSGAALSLGSTSAKTAGTISASVNGPRAIAIQPLDHLIISKTTSVKKAPLPVALQPPKKTAERKAAITDAPALSLPQYTDPQFASKSETTSPLYNRFSNSMEERSYTYARDAERTRHDGMTNTGEPFIPSYSFDKGQIPFPDPDSVENSAKRRMMEQDATLLKLLLLKERLIKTTQPDKKMQSEDQLQRGLRQRKFPSVRNKIVEI